MKGAHNFMESILNDLYHSRSDYFTRNYEMVPGFIDAMKQAEKLKEELKETLPESKHTLLNEYEEAMTTLFYVSCYGEFLSGYRFGMQLTVEGLADGRHPSDFILKVSN